MLTEVSAAAEQRWDDDHSDDCCSVATWKAWEGSERNGGWGVDAEKRNHREASSENPCSINLGLSENRLNPYTQWLMIIIPTKWLFHWGYTQHFQTYPYSEQCIYTQQEMHFKLSFPAPKTHALQGSTSAASNECCTWPWTSPRPGWKRAWCWWSRNWVRAKKLMDGGVFRCGSKWKIEMGPQMLV